MANGDTYTLEVEHCPGFLMVGGEHTVKLEPRGDDPAGQKWTVSAVFDPENGLVGWTLVNASSGGALKYAGENAPVQIGSARPPVEADVVWVIEPAEDGPYFVLSPVIDPEHQALDAPNNKTACSGATVECWSRNDGDHQRWRVTAVAQDDDQR